ncbi:hypothetical protein [Caulobacter sp. 17J80-11]|uniref:hypothetical protein n=1 Tax=Caulobacter sp. 17J80-11 TaxID=2763502 RepID=UPI00165394DD|nr:hypothetical protein [Caulobacter sp. 17J80-11]MBC6982682.1 hypothetical protein [Caulobacter sp. 17J80-11]
MPARLGVRWTIGDVSPAGFEALQISVASAVRLFGRETAYAVVVNGMSPAEAARRTGDVPDEVAWLSAPKLPPDVLAPYLGAGMAEGTAWKFAPLHVFPDRHELALDNDVILWEAPEAVRRWLEEGDPHARVIAADVKPAHGRFADLCGPEPRNSGIRGTPPGFDLGEALGRVLAMKPEVLHSELDEQGLQIAALSLDRPPLVVTTEEVSICSPFHPHQPQPGRCGAHFVGLNARDLPWRWYDRPATEVRLEHWRDLLPEMRRRAGLSAA